VTTTGMIQGTPSYMAPEQAMGQKVDRLADVYALGVVAFECLTGRVPYTGTTPVAILMKHVQEPVPEPTAAEVTAPVSAVLRRCLAKSPAERWPSAGAFATALDQAAVGATPVSLESLPTLEVPSEAAGRTPRDGTFGASVATPPATLRRKLAWAAAGFVGVLAVVALAGAMLVSRLWPGPPPPAAGVSSPSRPPATAARAPVHEPIVIPAAVPRATPRGHVAVPTPTPSAAVHAPTPAAVPTPTPAPLEPPTSSTTLPAEAKAVETPRPNAPVARARSGPVRVYCEAKLEPVLFRKTGEKDVADSLKDLREAIGKREGLELAASRAEADAVVQVLERGRDPAVIGMRKLRVRVLLGGESVELTGQDSMTGFNTWSGAAGGAAKQVETWLTRRLGSPSEEKNRR
jgi:hypothetical protein